MRSIFFIDKETAVRIIQARAGPRRKALPLKSYFLDLISDFRVYTKLETLSSVIIITLHITLVRSLAETSYYNILPSIRSLKHALLIFAAL